MFNSASYSPYIMRDWRNPENNRRKKQPQRPSQLPYRARVPKSTSTLGFKKNNSSRLDIFVERKLDRQPTCTPPSDLLFSVSPELKSNSEEPATIETNDTNSELLSTMSCSQSSDNKSEPHDQTQAPNSVTQHRSHVATVPSCRDGTSVVEMSSEKFNVTFSHVDSRTNGVWNTHEVPRKLQALRNILGDSIPTADVEAILVGMQYSKRFECSRVVSHSNGSAVVLAMNTSRSPDRNALLVDYALVRVEAHNSAQGFTGFFAKLFQPERLQLLQSQAANIAARVLLAHESDQVPHLRFDNSLAMLSDVSAFDHVPIRLLEQPTLTPARLEHQQLSYLDVIAADS